MIKIAIVEDEEKYQIQLEDCLNKFFIEKNIDF